MLLSLSVFGCFVTFTFYKMAEAAPSGSGSGSAQGAGGGAGTGFYVTPKKDCPHVAVRMSFLSRP